VLLGLSVGFLSITLTAPLLPQVTVDTVADQLNGDQSDDEQKPELSLKAFDAITSSVHISFNHDFLLIDILPDLDDQEEETTGHEQTVLPGSKVLKILFRRIISPNAP